MTTLKITGFQFSGIRAGIKETAKPDLALIYSNTSAAVAAGFTHSLVPAAPVQISKKHARSGLCRAVIINSGNANACTGSLGLKDAQRMVSETAKHLKISPKEVLVCSTGKIGIPLPMKKIIGAIPDVVKELSENGFDKSAEAILTTDLAAKTAHATGTIGGKPYTIAGFAKGAGMIEPHMVPVIPHATMLAFIMTDASVSPKVLNSLLQQGMDQTFNRITVDGDTSTNDTIILLANGSAQTKPLSLGTADGKKFAQNLHAVMESLAKQMVLDGEGATKCVKIQVEGAKSAAQARKLAYVLGNSLLVKTSFFGGDPNWGRLLGAGGRAGVPLKPDCVDIYYDDVCVAKHGVSTGPIKDREAKKVMQKKEFTIRFNCRLGKASFWIYASDLTIDYVKLNSCYRT